MILTHAGGLNCDVLPLDLSELTHLNGTSSGATAKLSLLVCILIFTMLPEPAVSVTAFTQGTSPFKQVYSLYIRYNAMSIKKYIP
jgi:hypothetical protein